MGDITKRSSDTFQHHGLQDLLTALLPRPNKPTSSAIWRMAPGAPSSTIPMIWPRPSHGRVGSGSFLCSWLLSAKSEDGRPVSHSEGDPYRKAQIHDASPSRLLGASKSIDPNQQAREEIQEAVFSRDEIMELPLQLQTQYFKVDESSVKLSVVSRLELKGVHFRKADGRNIDNLTVATVIFDDNGNFVAGGEKLVTMKLSRLYLRKTNSVRPYR